MCDYSAEHVDNRQAAVGDSLVTGHMSRHMTVGLLDANGVATCLLPGTTLIFTNIPRAAQQAWGVGPAATAVFDQLTEPDQKPGTYYRDGVIFAGTSDHVSLQDFAIGIGASVESLPDQTIAEPAAQSGNLVNA